MLLNMSLLADRKVAFIGIVSFWMLDFIKSTVSLRKKYVFLLVSLYFFHQMFLRSLLVTKTT